MKFKACLTPVATANTYESLLEIRSSVAEENKKSSPEDGLPSLGAKASSCSIYLCRTVNAKPGTCISD
jgi:hypothetical protein